MKTVSSLLLACGLLLSVAAYAQGPGGSPTGGVSFSASTFADKTVVAGEKVCYGLTARDDNGNVIRSWDQIGAPITITLYNSTANTDTSNQSWSADPGDYSWAMFYHNDSPLTKVSDNEWTLPQTAFVNGVAEICLIHTKADTAVYYEITPKFPPLNQRSESVTFTAGQTTNYLVMLTSAVPGKEQVFQFRKYEIFVAPRDRYLNITDDLMQTRFSARWPGEFVNSEPDLSDIFSGDVFIQGMTNYFLASTTIRELPNALGQLQWIRAFKHDDPTITGQSSNYEILSHAPYPFDLYLPPHQTVWRTDPFDQVREFTWEQKTPADPYTNILISAGSGEIGNDVVGYTWVCIDSVSLTHAQRIQSDNLGAMPKLTMTNYQLRGMALTMAGTDLAMSQSVYWFVEATDGLFVTKSTPPNNDPAQRPGHSLLILIPTDVERLPQAPSSLALSQNYPNPFNPTTNIRFEIVTGGKVSLKVYDVIGNEVATLANEYLAPGTYNAEFDGSKLASGVYIYRLTTNGATLTRRMVLNK